MEEQDPDEVRGHEFKKTGEGIRLGQSREHLRQEGTTKDDQIDILR